MKRPLQRKAEKADEKLLQIILLIEVAMRNIAAEHAGEDWHGIQPCPVCSGRLAIIHTASNGHIWAFCETSGCLRWME